MTNENATPEYIKIEDLPRIRRQTIWPWDEWAKIPEGKGLEVDCNGRTSREVATSLHVSVNHNTTGLKVMERSGHVFIYRPKAEAQP